MINGALLFGDKATPAEYGAGLRYAIDKGWLELHESGTFVTFTPGSRFVCVKHPANTKTPLGTDTAKPVGLTCVTSVQE